MKHCPECAEPMDQVFYLDDESDEGVCFLCYETFSADREYSAHLADEELQYQYPDEYEDDDDYED